MILSSVGGLLVVGGENACVCFDYLLCMHMCVPLLFLCGFALLVTVWRLIIACSFQCDAVPQ